MLEIGKQVHADQIMERVISSLVILFIRIYKLPVLGTKYCRAGQLLILIKSIIVFYIQKMTKIEKLALIDLYKVRHRGTDILTCEIFIMMRYISY